MTPRSFVVAVLTGARGMLAEPVALGALAAMQVVIVLTMGSLWRAAAEAAGGTLVGYDAAALVWYMVASEAAVAGVLSRLIERIGDDVAAGAVAAEMLRPASVVGLRIAGELGRGLPRVGVALLVGGAVALAIGAPPPGAGALALALPALVLSLGVNLALQHAVAACAFWLRDARSGWYVYQKLVFIVGGMIIPLEVLPDGLASVARLLPFAAIAYVPARLASGHVEPGLLAGQVAWLVVLAVAAVAAFGAGERRLQAVGG